MDHLKRIYEKYKPTGAKLCGIYNFAQPVAVILDLNLVKNILIKDFSNFSDRGVFYNGKDDPLSAHLFSLEGEKWKQLRAKLTPTFSSGKMKFMFPTVVEVGERFRDCLIDLIKDNDTFEMKDLCARFTTDIIGTVAFDIECNSLKDPNAWGMTILVHQHSTKKISEKTPILAILATIENRATTTEQPRDCLQKLVTVPLKKICHKKYIDLMLAYGEPFCHKVYMENAVL